MAVNNKAAMPAACSFDKSGGVGRKSDDAWRDVDLDNGEFEIGENNRKMPAHLDSNDLVDEENLSLGSWAPDGVGGESCITATSTDDCFSDNTDATDVKSEDISLEPDSSRTVATANGVIPTQHKPEVQLSVNGLISMTGLLRLDSNTFSTSSTDGGDASSRKSPLNYSNSEAEFEDINLDADAVQNVSQMDDETYRQTVCGQVYDLDSLHSYNSDTPSQGVATMTGQEKSFSSIIG